MDIDPGRRRNERGLALVSVLWIVAVLSLLTVFVLRAGQSAVSTARLSGERMQAAQLLDVAWARMVLDLTQTGRNFGAAAIVYKQVWHEAGGEISVSVTSDRGRIDLNSAQSAPLTMAMEKITDEERAAHIADAIADFSDTDNLTRPNGAEARDYAAARRRDAPLNRPFEDEDDLVKVLGVDRKIQRCLTPVITVHAQKNQIETQYSQSSIVQTISPRDHDRNRATSTGSTGVIIASVVGEPLRALFQARVGNSSVAREIVFRVTEDNSHPIWVIAVRDHSVGPTTPACE